MARLIAGSTNSLEYRALVAGVSTEVDSIAVVVTDGAGATVTLGHTPAWNSAASRYDLTLDPSEVPPTAVGETWDFVWTWAEAGATRRDVEHAIVYETDPPVSDSSMLVARTRDLLGEEVADFYKDDEEILPALVEGTAQMFSDLEFALPQTLTPIASVTGTGAYALPEGTVRVRVLRWHPTGARLIPISTTEYEALEHTYATANGTPAYFVHDQLTAEGLPQAILVPPPGETTVGAITGSIDSRPSSLATSGPTWHAQFHFVPCYWAAAKLLRKDMRPEAADDMLLEFELQKQAYRKFLGHARPPGIRATERVDAGYALRDPNIVNRIVTG